MEVECRQALLVPGGLRQVHVSDRVALGSLVSAVVSYLESAPPASDTRNCEPAADLTGYYSLTLCPYCYCLNKFFFLQILLLVFLSNEVDLKIFK